MAETGRSRPVEYYNPRPLLLGMCFFWGVIMGFCLFYFSPPKEFAKKPETTTEPILPEPPRPDRPTGPALTEVPDLPPESATPQKKSIETMEIDPPPALLTTEGGLTGKTAGPLRPPTARPASPPANPMAPPIPELMP